MRGVLRAGRGEGGGAQGMAGEGLSQGAVGGVVRTRDTVGQTDPPHIVRPSSRRPGRS